MSLKQENLKLKNALLYMARMVRGYEDKPNIFDPERPWDGTTEGFVRWCVENAPPDGVTPYVYDETNLFERMGRALWEQQVQLMIDVYAEDAGVDKAE